MALQTILLEELGDIPPTEEMLRWYIHTLAEHVGGKPALAWIPVGSERQMYLGFIEIPRLAELPKDVLKYIIRMMRPQQIPQKIHIVWINFKRSVGINVVIHILRRLERWKLVGERDSVIFIAHKFGEATSWDKIFPQHHFITVGELLSMYRMGKAWMR